jgi:hypothetical protein
MTIEETSSGVGDYSITFSFGELGGFQVTGLGAPNGTEEQRDEAFQSMVNHISTWPEASFVTGGKNFNTAYTITPDPV